MKRQKETIKKLGYQKNWRERSLWHKYVYKVVDRRRDMLLLGCIDDDFIY